MSVLAKPYFHNEKAAFRHLEKLLWANGVVCPKCRSVDRSGRLDGVKGKNGKIRLGLWKCYEAGCRKQFTVRVGTVFESAHIPLHKCLQAFHLMASSKKGISAHQLHRILEIQYKSAWFLAHRIREAMKDYRGMFTEPLGGAGKTVEVDETYLGRKAGTKAFLPVSEKQPVVALVERKGEVRSFHMPTIRANNLRSAMARNISVESHLMTDESKMYTYVGHNFASHGTVVHSNKEYVRGDVHTNTVEGYFSILKRGIYGVYQHVSEAHLNRYLSEFDFRYNNRIALGIDDQDRAEKAIAGAKGKRLYYRQPTADSLKGEAGGCYSVLTTESARYDAVRRGKAETSCPLCGVEGGKARLVRDYKTIQGFVVRRRAPVYPHGQFDHWRNLHQGKTRPNPAACDESSRPTRIGWSDSSH
jgi:transposase-like protein